jgi:hypothetical protein
MIDCFSQKDTIPPRFPGGIPAWQRYLYRNLNIRLIENSTAPEGKYTVFVMFKVDTLGNLSHIRALNDPGYGTAQEAVRVISVSGKWIPASVKGKLIEHENKQGITVIKGNYQLLNNTRERDSIMLNKLFSEDIPRLHQTDRDILRAGAVLADSLWRIKKEYDIKRIKIGTDVTLTKEERKAQSIQLAQQEKNRIQPIVNDPRYQKWNNWITEWVKDHAGPSRLKQTNR